MCECECECEREKGVREGRSVWLRPEEEEERWSVCWRPKLRPFPWLGEEQILGAERTAPRPLPQPTQGGSEQDALSISRLFSTKQLEQSFLNINSVI